MAKLAIIRVEKLKNLGAVSASAQHTFRERSTPNADPSRKFLNDGAGPDTAEKVVQGVRDRITPLVKRKDSVVCLEYLISASPEAFKGDGDLSASAYFRDSIKWLEKRHGAENVVCSMVHNDETTPHMTVYVVPVAEKRLSAKHYCGSRDKLVKLQTDFAEQVGKGYGVSRGKHRTVGDERISHQTVREWYGKGFAAVQLEIEAQKRNLELEWVKLEADRRHLDQLTGEVSKERDLLAKVRAGLDQRGSQQDEREANLEGFKTALNTDMRAFAANRTEYMEALIEKVSAAKDEAAKVKAALSLVTPVSPGRSR